jgi:hypothetical protein
LLLRLGQPRSGAKIDQQTIRLEQTISALPGVPVG